MSFRASLVRLAKEAQHRTPLIRFPDRKQQPAHHPATAHPCAPQSVVDAFSSFQQARANPRPSSSSSSGQKGQVYEEHSLPSWLRRKAPGEEEMEAVLSGGATEATPVTKDYQLKWHLAQI
ncbi:hypothetical protein JCM5296_005344 [Sporobolomyces johnsonii]